MVATIIVCLLSSHNKSLPDDRASGLLNSDKTEHLGESGGEAELVGEDIWLEDCDGLNESGKLAPLLDMTCKCGFVIRLFKVSERMVLLLVCVREKDNQSFFLFSCLLDFSPFILNLLITLKQLRRHQQH